MNARAREKALTSRQQVFCREFMVDRNAAAAARRAGYSRRTARSVGSENLTKPDIRGRITDLEKELADRLMLQAEQVVRRYQLIAFANATDLVTVEVNCCRYCHGIEHEYQWRTAEEFAAARTAWEVLPQKQRALAREPSVAGGYGFRTDRPPDHECPSCEGDGIPRLVVKDPALAPEGAKCLFAGAKHTRHGIEMKMHDQLVALQKLGEHLGIFKSGDQQKAGTGLGGEMAAILLKVARLRTR